MSEEPMSKPKETEGSAAGDKPEAAHPSPEEASETLSEEAAIDSESAQSDAAATEPQEPGDEGPDSAREESVDPAPDVIAALQAEVEDLKDRLLRAAAEMENLRRRSEREMADARQYAVTGFAREMLSIGDNLHRALSAVPDDVRDEGGVIKGLVEGVEMTERELLRALDKHGVKRLAPEGSKFDPNFHQAMFEVEHDDAAQGTVVQVMQHGYSIGDRVLRPALVGIAKAKTTKAANADAGETEDRASDDDVNPEATKGEAAKAEDSAANDS